MNDFHNVIALIRSCFNVLVYMTVELYYLVHPQIYTFSILQAMQHVFISTNKQLKSIKIKKQNEF